MATTFRIDYTPERWTPEQRAIHEADDLDAAFRHASMLAGGWYRRAVTIDYRVTAENNEQYMIRPSDVPVQDGWTPCYNVSRA
jgi:hypothetical protein